jgi:hypothetical protein
MAPTKTMKAARFRADTKKVAVEVVPIPRPGDDEMLVRTIGSGLCHSDMVRLTYLTLMLLKHCLLPIQPFQSTILSFFADAGRWSSTARRRSCRTTAP